MTIKLNSDMISSVSFDLTYFCFDWLGPCCYWSGSKLQKSAVNFHQEKCFWLKEEVQKINDLKKTNGKLSLCQITCSHQKKIFCKTSWEFEALTHDGRADIEDFVEDVPR